MNVLTQWLWRLLPGNPMAVRIVQGGSRRSRHLWVRLGYLGALVSLVLIGLLTAGGGGGGGLSGEVALSDLAKSGAWVFAVIAYAQVILVCLLAPLFMAAAIGQERAGETLQILLTTPLSNLQIVLGSLGGRLFFVLALLFSGLPLFSILLIFGGVPVASVFVAFAVAALTAVLVGSVAILLSTLRAGGRKAVFTFVIAVAAYLVAAYVLDVGLVRRLTPGGVQTTWITPLHPLLVLETSLASANYAPPSPEALAAHVWPIRFYRGRPFATFAALTLTISLVLVVTSALVLRRVGQGESRLVVWLKRRLRIKPPNTERRRAPRDVWHNPVAWREARTRGKIASGILARWGFIVIGLALAAGLLLAYHFGAFPTIPGAVSGGAPLPPHEAFQSTLLALLLLEVAAITLVAIYMSAGCVSREREDGTLDLVLTTPITPRFYVWGKLQGLVRFLSLLIAVPVLTVAMVSVYAVLGAALGWENATYTYSRTSMSGGQIVREPLLMLPEAPVLLAVMLVPFIALCVTAGMNWSLKARGVLGAIVPTVAVIGVVTLVLALCGTSAASGVPFIGAVINAFSPATNLLMIVNPWASIQGFADTPGVHRIWLGIAALAAAGGYSLVVWSLITGMVRGFDQTVRKLSGAG